MRRLFLTLCFLLVASIADAATYYVATTGDDIENDCTEAQSQSTPKRTINGGIVCLSSGDTIEIKTGTYNEVIDNNSLNIPSGTSFYNMTTIRNYGSDVVTVNGAGDIFNLTLGLHYFSIQGLIIDGINQSWPEVAISINGAHHLFIAYNEIKNCSQSCVLVNRDASENGGDTNQFIYNTVHHNGLSGYAQSNAFYITTDNNFVGGNVIHDIKAIGIRFFENTGLSSAGNIAVDNVIYNFSQAGAGIGSGIFLASTGNQAYRNIIYNGTGPGIIVNYNAPANNMIYNNIIYGNTQDGIQILDGDGGKIWNNTIYANGSYGISIAVEADTTTVQNNIALSNTSGQISDQSTTSTKDHNLEIGVPTDIWIDPANNDFHLKAGSSAVNSGANLSVYFTNDYDGVSRPQGGAWDIGALERVAALANYFYHDAETSPIAPSSTSTYQWSDAQSLVSRSQTRVKNGTWALLHQFVDPGTDNQVGKVIKFIDPTVGPPGPPFPNSEAWFSAWYYFDSAEGTVWQDPKNYNIWANHMQWKGDNNINYQTGTPNVHTEVKCVISMRYVNGVRRWMIDGLGFKYTPSGSTTYPIGTFPWNISGEPGKWANTTFVVPLDEWVFLEVYVRMTQQNGAIRVWSGTANEGILHLLYDMTASDFNFLTTFNQDGNHPNLEGTNQYLYWGIGNYQDWGHASGTYNLYTDDARIANGQVGPTLPEFTEEGPPPPPSSLQVSRKPAAGRIQSSARIQSSGRVQ